MSSPVLYIAGDVHHDGSDDAFIRWLDQLATKAPARLVILGDLVEWWIDAGSSSVRHEPVLGRLRHLRQLGWHIDVVRGNREVTAGRTFEIACGSRLVWPRLDIVLGSTRVRIVHGDRLVHDPAYRGWAALATSFAFRVWQRLHPAFIQELVAVWMRRNSHGNKPKVYRRIFIDPRRVRAAARGCDVLIAGHIHESWRRHYGGVDLMLVGHWPSGHGHWIEGYADGQLDRCSAAF
ncbi:MAG: metallophosphoesterase [Planctomycetota bacterium]